MMTIQECENWLDANTDLKPAKIDEFEAVFPKFMEAHTEAAFIRNLSKKLEARDKVISETLADFAVKHPKICRELPQQADGARRYEVTVRNITYRLTFTAGGWIRENGDDRTQDFLAGLPEKWVKATLRLDPSGIKRYASDEQIAAAGLIQQLRPEWSN